MIWTPHFFKKRPARHLVVAHHPFAEVVRPLNHFPYLGGIEANLPNKDTVMSLWEDGRFAHLV